MKVYKPKHSHPYFRPAEVRLPRRRAGMRVLGAEQTSKRQQVSS